MIKSKTVNININGSNVKYYKDLGYDISGSTCIVSVDDLKNGSHAKVSVICDVCGEEKSIMYRTYKKNIANYNIYCCSNKCSDFKNKKTSLKKYGVEHYSKTKEFIDRMVDTNLKKYGEEYYTRTNDYKELMKNTVIDYSEVYKKIKQTILLKYGNENYHQSDNYKNKKQEIIDKYKKTITNKIINKYENLISTDNITYKFLCENNHIFEISRDLLKNRTKANTILCTVCNQIGVSKSGYEIQLQDFVKENYSKDIIINKRNTIAPLELDIYLPDLKLAFEFNGLYWHNELNKPNNYHLEKTEACEKQGIQLIHIYEDDWIYKQDIIKSMILNRLGKTDNTIYARKTEIREVIDNKLIKNFLETNHIQGFIVSKIKLGLFYDDKLVSLMTFGKRRVAMGKKSTNEGEYELLRFCNKINTNVTGSASKLFKYFIKNYHPTEIITYADRSFSQGKLYSTLGFNFISKTQPNYFYIIDENRYHRFNYRKDVLIKQGYDKNKTEHEIMLGRNIYRIYDSGSLKFKFN